MSLRCHAHMLIAANRAPIARYLRVARLYADDLIVPCVLAMSLLCAAPQPLMGQGHSPVSTAQIGLLAPKKPEPKQAPQNSGWPWRTDTTRHKVPLSEFSIMLGRDAIPPIDRPQFVRAANSQETCPDREPAIVVTSGTLARAYPLRVLLWHEVINDRIGNLPIAVTFCPLCQAAIVFDRTVRSGEKTRLLDFGTSGLLRASDLVLWDRQTESWWQQMTGEALVGELAGSSLRLLPATVRSCASFRAEHPGGQVLVPNDPGLRPYGRTPYVGYEDNNPFALLAEADPSIAPTARVVGVCRNGTCRAYPWDLLAASGLIEDTLGGEPIALFYAPGAVSVMDAEQLIDSRDAGQVAVYATERNGRRMRFLRVSLGGKAGGDTSGNVRGDTGGKIDGQAGGKAGWEDGHGDIWRLDGRCISGSEEGEYLTPFVHHAVYAFAWFRFFPNSGLYAVPDNR